MQSTPASTLPATPHVHFTVPLSDIHTAFAAVPDPRRRQGTRFPLPAILTMAVAALSANHASLLAITEWGAARPLLSNARLAFPRTLPLTIPPCCASSNVSTPLPWRLP